MSDDKNKGPEQDTYTHRAARAHRHYTDTYREWINSLSPEELRSAKDLGLLEPEQDTHRVSGHAPNEDRDAAESSRARVEFNDTALATAESATSAPIAPSSNDWENPALMLTTQRVIGNLISAENVRISVLALAFALNLDALNGLGSIREAAAKIGVSPEALSKKKREWEAELNIPKNAFSKSEAAKASLSAAQLTKHWKKSTWKKSPNK